MIKLLYIGIVAGLCTSAHADSAVDLGLSAADLERLGVVLQAPRAVDATEVASGTAEVVIPPDRQAIVTAAVGGVVSRLLVAEGDLVTAGQSVAVIASPNLLELQSNYVAAAVAADLANRQLERDRSLLADGIIAERRVRESTATARTTAVALNQVRQKLALAGISDATLARLSEGGELSSTLELAAPFDSFVIEQLAGLGARVDALDPVYRVADLSKLWLEIHVPQERSESVRLGMRVTAATIDGTIEGTVSQIGRVADAASQTRVVRADIDNENLNVLVGRFLTARILDTAPDAGPAFAVPGAAIVRVEGGTYVFAETNGAMTAWPVDVVADNGIDTYVRGEFGPEVKVAIAGTASLKSVWLSVQGAEE